MKKTFLILFAAILALTVQTGRGQSTNSAADELHALVAKVNAKLQAGKTTEADLSGELKQFDALIAEHKGEKTDDVAAILYMKANLYLQVLDEPEKGAALIRQIKTDFPDTKFAAHADEILANIQKQIAAKKIQDALQAGTTFPDFNEKDLDGKPLSVAAFKGKVVLVDFWATWCPPCRAEMPNVIRAYEKYHDQGFEIIGVSLDQDRSQLADFIKTQKMPWPEYFDGLGWGNKLAAKYGIMAIPANVLIDANGKIIGKDLYGDDLANAVAKAIKS